MPSFRMLWLVLVVGLACTAGHRRAEASKLAMEKEQIHVDAGSTPEWPAQEEVTAAVQEELTPSAPGDAREPVQYDALPEHERRRDVLEQLLSLLAEA